MEPWTEIADRLHVMMRNGATKQEVEAQASAELDRMIAAKTDDEAARVMRHLRSLN